MPYSENSTLTALKDSFAVADEAISRSYLLDIVSKDVVPETDRAVANADLRLYRLQMLVFNQEENVNDKLQTVFSALLDSVEQVNLALIIRSHQSGNVEFYLGINANAETGSAAKLLQSGLLGNFPGSEVQKLSNESVEQCLQDIRGNGPKDIACLSVLPAARDEDKDKFVQGIEKFVDSLRGKEYTAILLAESLKRKVAEYRKAGLEMMYSALVPFSKTTLAFGENESHAVGTSISSSSSESLSKGASRSVSDSVSSSDSVSEGQSVSYRTDGLGDGWTFGHLSFELLFINVRAMSSKGEFYVVRRIGTYMGFASGRAGGYDENCTWRRCFAGRNGSCANGYHG